MKTAKLLLPLALLCACGTEEPAPTDGKVTGTVTANAAALEGVTVATDPATVTAVTDAQGKYSLTLKAGTYKVVFTKAAYLTKERPDVAVTAGADTTLDVAMDAALGSVKLVVNDKCGTAGLAAATVKRAGAADAQTGTDGTLVIDDLEPGTLTLSVSKAAYLPQSVEATVTAGTTAEKTVDLVCQSKVVGDAARAFLATVGTNSRVIPATTVHDRLHDADNTNDPVLIDVRAAADYAAGHATGAVNIPYKNVADDATLTLLGNPEGKTFVDYCYTGHTGGIAAAVLNLLGYMTSNMKFGIVSWTRDAAARGTIATPPDLSKNFETVTQAFTAEPVHTPPALANDNVTDAKTAVQAAAKAYLSNPAMKPTIAAQELFDNLNDGNTENDPFIISVRSPADYAKGHIKGAVNIPYAELAKEENLKKIPTDREIVVYCYTGHTGAVATGVLGTLGYHKVRNLKYGIHGWTQDATVRANAPFNDANDAHDFEIKTGANP